MRNKKVGSVTTDYSYLNQSRNHLNLVTGKENDSKLKIWRKNFATAAIIALASGTTMLFSAHSVKADEVDDASRPFACKTANGTAIPIGGGSANVYVNLAPVVNVGQNLVVDLSTQIFCHNDYPETITDYVTLQRGSAYGGVLSNFSGTVKYSGSSYPFPTTSETPRVVYNSRTDKPWPVALYLTPVSSAGGVAIKAGSLIAVLILRQTNNYNSDDFQFVWNIYANNDVVVPTGGGTVPTVTPTDPGKDTQVPYTPVTPTNPDNPVIPTPQPEPNPDNGKDKPVDPSKPSDDPVHPEYPGIKRGQDKPDKEKTDKKRNGKTKGKENTPTGRDAVKRAGRSDDALKLASEAKNRRMTIQGKNEELPQAGEDHNAMALIGLAFATLAGSVVFATDRKRR